MTTDSAVRPYRIFLGKRSPDGPRGSVVPIAVEYANIAIARPTKRKRTFATRWKDRARRGILIID
jgi:hypothetical protein